MKPLEVLLVTHDLGYTDNIAIAFLSSIAKQAGHSVHYCSMDKEDLSLKILKVKPDIVGYSVNYLGYKRVVEENKKAKEVHNFISIMGGPFPTMYPETFENSGMDAYCIGEGEYPFRDFLQRIKSGREFDDIENLITKKKKNPVRPLIENLDELPMPNRDLVFSNTFLSQTSKKTFFTSRGCPYGCTYCCNNHFNKLYKGKGKIVRRFSVERVLKEIEDVKSKYKTKFIKFDDDCFALRVDDWLKEFSEKYPKRINIPFNCVIRLDVLNDELLSLLKKAGCYSIHVSIDSTSEYIRENILRRKMKEDIVEKLLLVKKYGVNTYVNYMPAVPESNVQDDLDTIAMSKKAKATYIEYTTTVPLRGTDLYGYCKEKGYLPEDYDEENAGFDKKSVLSCFSEKEKNIRLNVNLMGAFISKMPFPLDKIMLQVIKFVPPNKYFRKIHEMLYQYYMGNKIYKF